ncbi:MAG: malto-oligosyltrehalose synthase [Beijerinckiaceae bacterium]|nr:malto-oligosyltrehalose synthase [Beijerinckiaceae bacterium]
MNRPLVATYRLQFREGTTFDTARDLVPYLQALGISHLYASPIFAASPESTHGYDVVDYNRFEEDLGGDSGFIAMSDALMAGGLGLILDFVPNHMGVSQRNAWWEDVLRWGSESRHAQTFDISWDAEKILIPILGKPYGAALRDSDIAIVFDEKRKELRLDVSGYSLPLDPRTFSHVFVLLDHEERDVLVRRFSAAIPADGDDLADRFAEQLHDAAFGSALTRAVDAINADKAALHKLHEAQPWRLAWWRLAREKLSYRRFFEIADLIGVRQEIRRVFQESHRTVVRLVRECRVDGIRIDHVDGVADPKNYLVELAHSIRSVRQAPLILVEKILTGTERLRTSWPIKGTTGYEFITAVSGLYVDPAQEDAMTRTYVGFVGRDEDLRHMITNQKREIFAHNLAGELTFLTDEAIAVAARGLETRDLGRDAISRSIVEVAAALPVYRTYVGIDGAPEKDVETIEGAVRVAQSRRAVEADEPVDFIGRLLKLDFEDGRDVTGALNFARRFQQTTGAVMAKAVEDTVFYRYNRLIALNEVGGEPDHYGAGGASFHEAMRIRVEDQPEGLLASSTHDTKRGEDARARLYTLSEAPETWAAIVARAAQQLSTYRKPVEDGLNSPDAATEWGFYQSLLGVLPADFDPADEVARAAIASRLTAFMQKSVREAKRYTSWTAPAEPYERALTAFVQAAMSTAQSGSFLDDFWRASQPFIVAGALNSLSQTLLKLTAPGVQTFIRGPNSTTSAWSILITVVQLISRRGRT